MHRLLPLLLLAALAAPLASAQGGYYNTLDDRDEASEARGVRLGLGVGPYVYHGPDILVGEAAFQDEVVATNLGVTAELTVPVTRRVYGRLMGGLVNIGADDLRADVVPADANPYLTNQSILAEGDLLFYLTPPRRTGLAPYLFSGVSGIFATGDAAPGVKKAALAIPVGLGLELGLGRNLALYAEASYRFGIASVGEEAAVLAAAVRALDDDVDCKDPANADDPKCKPSCAEAPNDPECIPCEDDPTLPGCPEVIDEGDSGFDTRFNSALFLGGLRLGFGRAPAPVIPPPAPLPPPPAPEPPPAPAPPPAPLVCDIVELNSIYFDYGFSSLSPRARTLLDENVGLLLDNPACCIFIDGYTDTSESGEFGIPLSARRAQSVYDYYLSQGVESTRLHIRNRGEAVPSCDKEDPGPGCERNRRVESLPVDCERFEALIESSTYDRY